jgi:hypothetical protein
MLSDIETGRVEAVVAWDLDRLHRRPTELEKFIDLADRHKIALGTVGGDVDLSSSGGRLHARIMGSVAKHEMEHKSERQRRAGLQKAQQGLPTGGPRPFGFKAGGIKLDATEARAIRNSYKALLAGTSLRELARDLNRREISTSLGKPWGATQVRAMLLRPRNAGLRLYHGEVMGTGRWPALVDESTWRAAVAVLSDPKRKTSPGFAIRWLLSGLALCGTCGQTVSSAGSAQTRKDGSKRIVYRCRSRQHVARHAAPVDDLVSRVAIERLASPDAAALLVDGDAPDAEELKDKAQALRSRLESLAVDFADGDLTSAQLRAATARIKTQLAEIESLQAHNSRGPMLAGLVNANDVGKAWRLLPFDGKRSVIDILMVVTIEPESIRGARHFRPELIRIAWRTP